MVTPITGPTDSYNPTSPTTSSIQADLATAQSSYTSAQNAVNSATAPYTTSKNAIPGLVASYNSAVTDYNNAVTAQNAAQLAYNSAQSAQSTAQTNYNNALSAQSSAQTAYNNALSARDAAQTTLTNDTNTANGYFTTVLTPALNNYNQQLALLNQIPVGTAAYIQQQQIVAAAYQVYQNDLATYNGYLSTVATDQTNLNNANSNLTTASNNLTTANNNLASASSALTTANNNLSTANNNLTAANNTLTSATTAKTNAQTAMDAGFTDFDTKRNAYYSALTSFQAAAGHLIDVKGYLLQYYDNTSSGDIQSLLDQLNTEMDSGIIDTATYNTLTSQLNDLTTARTNYTSKLQTLMADPYNIATYNIQYIENSDAAYIASNKGNTNDYNTYTAVANNFQSFLTAVRAKRDTDYNNLSTAATDFSTAYQTLQTSLQSVTSNIPTIVAAFNTALANIQQTATTFMDSIKQQLTSDDAAALSAYEASTPSIDTSTESQILTGTSQYDATSNAIIKTGIHTGAIPQISLPALPAAGQLSMSDLMRFITEVQNYIQELLQNAQTTDAMVKGYRLKLLQTQQAASASASQTRFTQLLNVYETDKVYSQLVRSDNLNRYYAAVDAINNYNNNLGNIKTAITDFNKSIDAFNDNALSVTSQINQIAPEVTNTTSEGVSVSSDSINNLNILGGEQSYNSVGFSVSTPTPLPDPPLENKLDDNLTAVTITVPPYDETPGAIPSEQQYQEMLSLGQLPPYVNPSTVQPPSQADIDALNAKILEINANLTPILDKISTSPINFQEIPPLVYRSELTVRDIGSTFDFLNVLQAFGPLIVFIFGFISQQPKPVGDFEKSLLQNLNNLVSGSLVPQASAQQVQGIGGGVGISTSNINMSPSRMSDIVNALFQSQDLADLFSNIAQIVSIVSGIGTAALLPNQNPNYSVFGIVQNAKNAQTQEAQNAQTQQTVTTQLTTGILQSVGNLGALTTNALQLLANAPGAKKANADEIKLLQKLLVFLQQLLLLLLGAAAGAIGAGNINAQQLGQTIQQLFQPAAAPNALLNSNQAITQFSTDLRAIGFSSEVSNAVTNLLAGTTQPLSSIETLNKNGFNLNASQNPQSVSFTQDLLNQLQTQAERLPPIETVPIPPSRVLEIPTPEPFPIENEISIPTETSIFTQTTATPGTITTPFGQIPASPFTSTPSAFPSPAQRNASPIEPQPTQEEIINQANSRQDILTQDISRALLQSGILQEDTTRFEQKVNSGEQIGTAYAETLQNSPNSLVEKLKIPVPLSQLPQEQQTKIAAIVAPLTKSLPELSDKARQNLIFGISTGQIPASQATSIVSALLTIQHTGVTPTNIAQLAAAINGTGPTPTQTTKAEIAVSSEIVNSIHDALTLISNDKVDQAYVNKLGEEFGKFIENQTSFFNFSLDFLMDPANSILKNFSPMTSQTTGPYHQLPTSIPV